MALTRQDDQTFYRLTRLQRQALLDVYEGNQDDDFDDDYDDDRDDEMGG